MRVASLFLVAWMIASVCFGEIISREEALKQAFPGGQIQSSMVFLTEQEMKEAAAKAGVKIPTALIARYIVDIHGTVVGRAYLDTHVVRTKKESLLILLNADGSVKRTEVVAFDEPPEYLPSQKWYDQFRDKTLSTDLTLQGQIHPVTGASLTARATVEAVRRALAIDQVLQKKQDPK